MRVRVLSFVSAIVLTVTGGSSSAAVKNTCELITKNEMETVLGVPMRAPEVQIMGMCEYKSIGDHPYKSVLLMLNHADSRDGWDKHQRELDPDVKAALVPGIADETLFWNRVTDARLAMIKGTTTLTMVVNVGKVLAKPAETLPVAHRLAEIAAGRLP